METTLLDIIAEPITGTIMITFQIEVYKLLNKIDKIKLIKKNKFQNFKVIESPPIIRKTKSKKESNIKDIKEIEQIVQAFLRRLSIYITNEEMEQIENNLKTLQYKKSNILFLKLTNSCGYYALKKHYIAANTNKEKDTFNHIIYHELLHAVTSSYNKNIYYCGFEQINTKKHTQIGTLLNEGYTDLLTNRMFYYNDNVGYDYGRSIAQLVEFLVDGNKMQKLFFSLNLEGLIDELAKYNDINKVKQFILNLDTIHALYNTEGQHERETLTNLYNEVSIFLYETFQNKMDQTINVNNIAGYEFLSNRFIKLFNETIKHMVFTTEETIDELNREEKMTYEEYIKEKNTFKNIEYKPSKTLIRRKKYNNKGFINILTISALLTIISFLSIGVSYLLLQAR